jgi:hypothetical protein
VHIVITKQTDARHLFEVVRDSGRERVELETRSYLLHDFIHYAVEATAQLDQGFYGRLAAGDTLAELNRRDSAAPDQVAAAVIEPASDSPLGQIEKVTAALTRFAQGRQSAAEALRMFDLGAESSGRARPEWVDEAFLERVKQRLFQLTGHWKALHHGQSMTLPWPAPPLAAVVPAATERVRRGR